MATCAARAAAAGAKFATSRRPPFSVSSDPCFSSVASVPPKRTLALSVHFRQPDFGMKSHEILSRATAFLLAVDPPDPLDLPPEEGSDPLEIIMKRREEERTRERLARHYFAEPAGGPSRNAEDLGWLEFCPRRHRPAAHVVAASHVLSPWIWKQYYPHDWLDKVGLEHCSYTLDVLDTDAEGGGGGVDGVEEKRGDGGTVEPLATFALNPYPIHHPGGVDLAILHFKQEDAGELEGRSHAFRRAQKPHHRPSVFVLRALS